MTAEDLTEACASGDNVEDDHPQELNQALRQRSDERLQLDPLGAALISEITISGGVLSRGQSNGVMPISRLCSSDA